MFQKIIESVQIFAFNEIHLNLDKKFEFQREIPNSGFFKVNSFLSDN